MQSVWRILFHAVASIGMVAYGVWASNLLATGQIPGHVDRVLILIGVVVGFCAAPFMFWIGVVMPLRGRGRN